MRINIDIRKIENGFIAEDNYEEEEKFCQTFQEAVVHAISVLRNFGEEEKVSLQSSQEPKARPKKAAKEKAKEKKPEKKKKEKVSQVDLLSPKTGRVSKFGDAKVGDLIKKFNDRICVADMAKHLGIDPQVVYYRLGLLRKEGKIEGKPGREKLLPDRKCDYCGDVHNGKGHGLKGEFCSKTCLISYKNDQE